MPERASKGASIVRRTQFAVAGVATVVVLLAFVVFYAAWLRYTLDTRVAELGRQTMAIAEGLDAGGSLWADPLTPTMQVRRALFRVQAGLIGAQLSVTDARGNVRFSSEATPAAAYRIAQLGRPDARGVRSALMRGDTGRWVVIATPLRDEAGYVVALQSVAEMRQTQWPALGLLALCALLAVLAGWLVGGLAARRLSARVLRLDRAAQDVAAGEWGRQVEVEGTDEIASLAGSFNVMSARVAAAYGAQQDFVGNVSHELRTPITSIQGFATALLDGVATTDEDRHHFLVIIRDEAARLADLTRALLGLADIDAGRLSLGRVAVDTEALADVLRDRHVAAGAKRGVHVSVGRLDCGGARPLGDDARLLQVASALVDNAVAYTPAGGSVEVSASCEDGSWTLRVDDAGPGVPVAERARIFERFVRLDPSRSSRTGGSGLGLAIASRLTTLMGGQIGVTDAPLGGARFWISLPSAEATTREILNTDTTSAERAGNAVRR